MVILYTKHFAGCDCQYQALSNARDRLYTPKARQAPPKQSLRENPRSSEAGYQHLPVTGYESPGVLVEPMTPPFGGRTSWYEEKRERGEERNISS